MSTQAITEVLSGVIPCGLAKGLSRVISRRVLTLVIAKSSSRVTLWEVPKISSRVSPRCTVFGKERQWCASLTHQSYPGFGNPWEQAQSTNQSVVTPTKNMQWTEPVAVGIGQYVYSVTNKVTPVDFCVCRPCCGRQSCMCMGPCFGQ